MKYTYLLFSILTYSAIINAQFGENIKIQSNHSPALIDHRKEIQFNKDESRVTFDFVSEETTGTIGGLDFSIHLNPEDIDSATFKGSASVDELETGNFLRDGHLMWKKFFHKSKYPKISFESTRIEQVQGNTFKVIGNLFIKGTTKKVSIDFTLKTKELVGKTTIYTSDYDIYIKDDREQNKLNITFVFPVLPY